MAECARRPGTIVWRAGESARVEVKESVGFGDGKSMRDTFPQRSRRRIIANLLFAAGTLTFASLQGALAESQSQSRPPQIEEGWVLPSDLEKRLQSPNGSRLDPYAAKKPDPETNPSRGGLQGEKATPPRSPSSSEEEPRRRGGEPWCWPK